MTSVHIGSHAALVLNIGAVETDHHLVGVRVDTCVFMNVVGPDKIAFTDGLSRRKVLVSGAEQ
ncbi:hypothetical protein ITP53_15825 [Nonomuraea sp. K274]|uniref:Uncharacterized protein n=1 Tax=Nonomuraea cypriaca TaxID=1187855 RepID=A0A931F183_9ACTN|nr:hypothetical protein [Nonomuraea cypriaca]MBF8187178.1 hypothetical protein [Nonomuraea cypriaca]